MRPNILVSKSILQGDSRGDTKTGTGHHGGTTSPRGNSQGKNHSGKK